MQPASVLHAAHPSSPDGSNEDVPVIITGYTIVVNDVDIYVLQPILFRSSAGFHQPLQLIL